MGNHREQARQRREAELYALQTAIEAYKAKHNQYPSDKALAESLQWPVWRVKGHMAYLTSQGLGRRATLVPSQNPVTYDTLFSDIDKLLAGGSDKYRIGEQVLEYLGLVRWLY